jgi:hypothetical protein
MFSGTENHLIKDKTQTSSPKASLQSALDLDDGSDFEDLQTVDITMEDTQIQLSPMRFTPESSNDVESTRRRERFQRQKRTLLSLFLQSTNFDFISFIVLL